MFNFLFDPQTWISLLTLTALEIILGVDNLVFISLISGRLPPQKRKPARQWGLALACITRLLLLGGITWITKISYPLFTLFGNVFSWRDLVFIFGGLFLLAKSTSEIHVNVSDQLETESKKPSLSFTSVLIQIMVLDIIFSLDSVITAVGMAQEYIIMAVAIIIAVVLMIVASEPLSRFINTYPTLKMLALSFLLLVGIVLIADGFSFHIPRAYIYFAIAFSVFVEILNIVTTRRRKRKRIRDN